MQHKLSGIERELVLKYLQDANVPVTVTLLESLPETGLHSPSSAVLTSICFIMVPALPGTLFPSLDTATVGEHSVNPYPFKT